MKAYWMSENKNENTDATNVIASKKSFNEIKANQRQAEAILALQNHVFGSIDGYRKFRESEEEFPKFYRNFKNFILLCNEEEFDKEWFTNLVCLCPKVHVFSINNNHSNDSTESCHDTYNSIPTNKLQSIFGLIESTGIDMDELLEIISSRRSTVNN